VEPHLLTDELPDAVTRLREGLARRIVGMEDVVEHVLYCLLCNDHGLLVGVPGLAKTLLCSSLASMLDLQFKRIQFTPDLMPGDIVGSETLARLEDGGRGFRFVEGPIFTNLVLADEINRTPPKTQAAMMEAMEERCVTSGGRRRPLPSPFLVLATQNPIEQEGTYVLPAAQLDRFLVRIEVTYPDLDDERRIVRRTTAGTMPDLGPVLTRGEILALQQIVRDVRPEHDVTRYATRLARATRPGEEAPETIEGLVAWGAGPRAAQALVMASKARALLRGRRKPRCEDVRAVLPAVMRHRIVPSYNAEAEGIGPLEIVRRVRDAVPAPDGWRPEVPEERPGFLARLFGRRSGTRTNEAAQPAG
jgi:MoxR-like ATPase